jgi:hypothetical protein
MKRILAKVTIGSFLLVLSGALAAQNATPAAKKPSKKAPAAKKAEGAEKPGMAAPKPDAEMSQLKYFVGRWSCKGTTHASAFGPEHPTTATVKSALELGGYFVAGSYEEAKTKENPMPYRIHFYWAHDGKEKKFDAYTFDVFGGAGKTEATGWDGDVLAFSGEAMMMGEKTQVRDTFTKKGENEFQHKGEMQHDGAWMATDDESCTRAAAKK